MEQMALTCDPFVFGPAFAIERAPGKCLMLKFSSGKVRPYIERPPAWNTSVITLEIRKHACSLQRQYHAAHHAIGLQTDCMVVVPAPVVRLPDSHVYALWP